MSEGVALVTGGSRGIGAAIARTLAAGGREVAINYRNDAGAAKEVAAEIAGTGGECLVVRADVGSSSEVDAMFDEVEDAFGPVTSLVNNAGITSDGLSLSMSDEAFMDVIRTDLFGTFACCRRALRSMLRTGGGRIVNVASVAGTRGSVGQVNYAAAKAGVIALTRTLALEVGRKGITINAVAPGIVATELTGALPPVRLKALVGEVPARRPGSPQEVAAAVAFLCGDDSAYVNGSVVVIDGGLTA